MEKNKYKFKKVYKFKAGSQEQDYQKMQLIKKIRDADVRVKITYVQPHFLGDDEVIKTKPFYVVIQDYDTIFLNTHRKNSLGSFTSPLATMLSSENQKYISPHQILEIEIVDE